MTLSPFQKKLLVALGSALLFMYIGLSYLLFEVITAIPDVCPPAETVQPDTFTLANMSAEPYHMATYETVRFPARDDDDISLEAWYIPGERETAVIVVHGLGSCKSGVLLVSGMLHRAGHSVLAVDVRDHGGSTIEDERQSGGLEEYLDVLGAWDWLREERGFADENIGLYGVSFGASTSMMAYGEEPRIASLWSDSGYGSVQTIIRDELRRVGYPTFFASSGLLLGNFFVDENLFRPGPLGTLDGNVAGRPLFITHGTDDGRVDIKHAFDIATLAAQQDADFEMWIVRDTGHTLAIVEQPDTYEARLHAFFEATLGNE